MEQLCDQDCNHCPIINDKNSRQLSLIFNKLLQQLGKKVYKIVQEGCPNMTVCNECRVDDFTHVEGCTILGQIDRDESLDITPHQYLPL
jgi:hypothetical protein